MFTFCPYTRNTAKQYVRTRILARTRALPKYRTCVYHNERLNLKNLQGAIAQDFGKNIEFEPFKLHLPQ